MCSGYVLANLGTDGDFDFFNARGLINGDKHRSGGSRYPGRTQGQGIAAVAMRCLRYINRA
ncbi:hypothetical protein RA20_10155 [Leisingera sp. ANG-Vp]|nr:hypothetical protein RA20_10155 [Leisingera sp. ANG-Vp]